MRKQYHLRQSEHGLLAWDVDKLILLTSHLKITDYPLSDISELDEPYWYSHEGKRPTCRSIAEHMRLVQAADLAYPIILCPEGRLMDGMHRAVKALLKDQTSLPAYRLLVMPEPDYVGIEADALPYE